MLAFCRSNFKIFGFRATWEFTGSSELRLRWAICISLYVSTFVRNLEGDANKDIGRYLLVSPFDVFVFGTATTSLVWREQDEKKLHN